MPNRQSHSWTSGIRLRPTAADKTECIYAPALRAHQDYLAQLPSRTEILRHALTTGDIEGAMDAALSLDLIALWLVDPR